LTLLLMILYMLCAFLATFQKILTLTIKFYPNHYQLFVLEHTQILLFFALAQTTGNDLDKILWLKSKSSEIWLERRTTYTRSLAVMSMVGYILGLGDRHPCNLMLHRHTGKIIHIDFGDCFEVAMHREKYPEKIPFRLTRMLIKAMEVSGLEGNFRLTCESVMKVLRENKDSLMAVLEAFVYDPLINWRLITHTYNDTDSPPSGMLTSNNTDALPNTPASLATRRPSSNAHISETESSMTEIINERALTVMKRINKKLTGRDFSTNANANPIDVTTQVERLIALATSPGNLCQCYIGWCPFW